MKIAIIGSRNYKPLSNVTDYLERLRKLLPWIVVVTGGASGVDKTAEEWCLRNGITCKVIKPINPSDKFSYLLRNVEIITTSNQVIAFHDGESKGTQFVIDYCNARGKYLKIIK